MKCWLRWGRGQRSDVLRLVVLRSRLLGHLRGNNLLLHLGAFLKIHSYSTCWDIEVSTKETKVSTKGDQSVNKGEKTCELDIPWQEAWAGRPSAPVS